jgi:hypothetical protein
MGSMANPINHVRWQRPIAAFCLFLVLVGVVAGAVHAIRAADAAPPPHAVRR